MTGRRISIALAAMLVALAAFAGWLAAWLEDQPPSQSIDPHHAGAGVAGIFAACLCAVALWQLGQVTRGRGAWSAASLWLVLAVAALLVVDLVALASRLGG